MKTLLVINPNSTVAVTDAIDALAAVHRGPGLTIRCETLAEGPSELSGYADRARVTLPLIARVREAEADAVVVACFGDPGVQALREAVNIPVYGIGETGYLVAMSRGDRFGILSTGPRAVKRHLRGLREAGLEGHLAADLPIGMMMADLPRDPAATLARMAEVGRDLIAAGADSIVTGCAGMAPFMADLSRELKIPVVEPTLATIGLAAANLRAGI